VRRTGAADTALRWRAWLTMMRRTTVLALFWPVPPAHDLPKLAATGTALTNSAVTAASIGIAPALDSRTNAIATGSRPIERRTHD